MNLFLISFAVLVLWIASLWAHPFGRCHRCHGRRVVIRGARRKGKAPRARTCKACKGIGRRQRPGSRTLHRAVRYLAAYRNRKEHVR